MNTFARYCKTKCILYSFLFFLDIWRSSHRQTSTRLKTQPAVYSTPSHSLCHRAMLPLLIHFLPSRGQADFLPVLSMSLKWLMSHLSHKPLVLGKSPTRLHQSLIVSLCIWHFLGTKFIHAVQQEKAPHIFHACLRGISAPLLWRIDDDIPFLNESLWKTTSRTDGHSDLKIKAFIWRIEETHKHQRYKYLRAAVHFIIKQWLVSILLFVCSHITSCVSPGAIRSINCIG